MGRFQAALLAAAAVWTGLFAPGVRADAAAEARRVFEESRAAATQGPADVPLAGQGRLKLPAAHLFIGQTNATRLLNAMGNPGQDERLLGLVLPTDGSDWLMTLRYEVSGHIKDDDARDWNADDLLKSHREGTEAANAERVKMGVPALEIVGWAERPAYDSATHRLVWAMSSRHKAAPANEPQGVNYNTYVLGREGYFSLNLVTALDELPRHKAAAHSMLAALDFDEGRRYGDFNASTDHVAEYGLAALVVGAAAKKLGFLAALGVFFAKFAKLILLGVALLGGLAMKLLKGRKARAAVPPAAPPGQQP